jgi:hypothetical protein
VPDDGLAIPVFPGLFTAQDRKVNAFAPTGIVNDREFRQHLIKLRLERERKEAEAANAAVKKPPATAKSQKAKKKRSA